MRNYFNSIMKKSSRFVQQFYMLALLAVLCSCTNEFDLQLEKNERKLVVEGWVTDRPGPYLVRLTKSAPGLGTRRSDGSGIYVEPVRDALVIISDNAGTIDTLRPRISPSPENDFFTIQNGYYETTKIQGKAGRTYFLKIKSQNKEHTASSYMPSVTTIDSLAIVEKKNPFKKDETYRVPVISFHEPQNTRDYYLFSLGGSNEWQPFYFGGSNRHWNVSILSDELLPAYVKDYSVDDGVSPSGMDFYFLNNAFQIRVNMHSLTREAYEYYKALISQFNNDGGAYKPAPASPPGNISNGAVGFFGASSVTYKVVF